MSAARGSGPRRMSPALVRTGGFVLRGGAAEGQRGGEHPAGGAIREWGGRKGSSSFAFGERAGLRTLFQWGGQNREYSH